MAFARFVDNEAEAPVLVKERQPIASRVFIVSAFAEDRDLSFAHLSLNEGGLHIEPASDYSCIDAKVALLDLHDGHGLRFRPPKDPSSSDSR
jgi:hypothetical protein